ncbi:MAG: hypothetical protein OXS29_00685 [bacterium]|nr:hypothetical protein [bacterium]MDE0290579.1 hypothetical protein [bacterium]MDE0437438.1 hypothetical protein [bacterium]
MRVGTDCATVIRRLPGEDDFSDEVKEFLAVLRSIPEVPAEDDRNGGFHQIRDRLIGTPAERMEWRVGFADGVLHYQNQLGWRRHVTFDPVRLLGTLVVGGVTFGVVGMGAGYLQGAPYPLYGIDVTPGWVVGTQRGSRSLLGRWTPGSWSGTNGSRPR